MGAEVKARYVGWLAFIVTCVLILANHYDLFDASPAELECANRADFRRAELHYDACLAARTPEATCRRETEDAYHLKELK